MAKLRPLYITEEIGEMTRAVNHPVPIGSFVEFANFATMQIEFGRIVGVAPSAATDSWIYDVDTGSRRSFTATRYDLVRILPVPEGDAAGWLLARI